MTLLLLMAKNSSSSYVISNVHEWVVKNDSCSCLNIMHHMCCICSWEQNIAKMELFSCSDCSQEQNVAKSGLFSCSQEWNRAKNSSFSCSECSREQNVP